MVMRCQSPNLPLVWQSSQASQKCKHRLANLSVNVTIVLGNLGVQIVECLRLLLVATVEVHGDA